MRSLTIGAVALLTACAVPDTAPINVGGPVRIVLFGDSNTDMGWSDSLETVVATSYISSPFDGRLGPSDPPNRTQLAGKIERPGIHAITHAIGGTNTNATIAPRNGHPNARYSVNGVTRFEGEVLGMAFPWRFEGISRVQSFTPTVHDFVYISLGTNDCRYDGSYTETTANLEWMVTRWTAHGLPASHVLLATIPPTPDHPECDTPAENRSIRAMAKSHGVTVIDIALFTSADDGLTWRGPEYCMLSDTNDVHYREWVRAWIGDEIVKAVQR